MKIKINEKQEVNLKTLSMCCKVSDSFSATFKDDNGTTIVSYDGYVPNFMPGDHYGDYLKLQIDINTGQITNWKQVNEGFIESVEEFINEQLIQEEDF